MRAWGGRRFGPVHVDWSWPSMVLPRVQVLLAPGGTDDARDDHLTVAVELSDQGGDPVLGVTLTLPWRWRRPWQCEVCVPPKHGRRDLLFVWREPGRARAAA